MSPMHEAQQSRVLPSQRKGHGPCDCCGLLAPRAQLLPWLRRMECRELAVLDPERRPNRRPEQEWLVGLFRHYYVTHENWVCHVCFDHLLDGGEFASVRRDRAKIAFLILGAVVVFLIVILPAILPVLRSALWLEHAEN